MVNIITLSVAFGTNCYIVYQDHSQTAIVIDPGGQGNLIAKRLAENDLVLKAVFVTHGHFDHVYGLKDLIARQQAKPDVYISKLELEMECYPYRPALLDGVDLLFYEDYDDTINIGSLSAKIIHTPGHSPGSVCIQIDNVLFSGDAIVKGAIGRTDFYGGDMEAMKESLHIISSLDKDVVIMPGHDSATTLIDELKMNPYLSGFWADLVYVLPINFPKLVPSSDMLGQLETLQPKYGRDLRR